MLFFRINIRKDENYVTRYINLLILLHLMKQFIAVIIAILYMGSTTGATLHMHYCMGKLVDSGLWHNESKTCGKCGMHKDKEAKDGCCKDEHKQVKLETDHKAATGYFLSQLFTIGAPATFFELPAIDLPSIAEKNPVSNAPPRSTGIAVYIRNCVFRI